jgi:fatty-acyl-CoA synthase
MNIGESLPRNAQHFPEKPAIVDAYRSVTFRDLHLRTNRLGNYLLKNGIGRGDIVGLSCGSRAEHFEALFALAKIGAIAVPYDYHWSAQECAAMVKFFGPKAFIIESRKETEQLAASVRDGIAASAVLSIGGSCGVEGVVYEDAIERGQAQDPETNVSGSDPFLLMITSGTTGFPKACSINHATYALRCINYGLTKGMNKNERALMALPVHFNAGRGSVMSILYLGGTIYIQEKFDEKTVLETIAREKITYTMMVPVLCERLLRFHALNREQTSSLRYLGITGGHLAPELAREIRARICPELYEAYASTDCGQMTTIGPEDWAARGDTVGKPIWCVLLKIADDDGSELQVGEQGEICVRTPLAIQGYYQNTAATEEFLAGGWCHTGDVGFLDSEGYLHVSGRKKNMIKSGGISVFPEEIEDTLRQHPAVMEAAVLGFKSAEWGEAVKAFVVLNRGAQCSAETLIQFCKGALASYKAPKFVEFVATLPRTDLGKIDRSKLEMMNREKR